MALFINETCTYCAACEPECPVEAISAGEEVYVIDPDVCNECEGLDAQACVSVCPEECIVQG